MYNAEKYIGEGLESLLEQTFQDFEVIVVDDCSADSSRAIVESYIPKFDGRLKLFTMKKNTGGGALPRNKGLTLSVGEYVYFMDSDDLLTPTALEELYSSAKKYDADVVYCEKFFKADDTGKNIELKIAQGSKRVKKPTLEPDNLEERVKYIVRKNFWGTPWSKIVRREFLLDNELFFPNVKSCQDHLWTYGLFFFAKRFLRIPDAVYIWRMSKVSVTRGKKTSVQKFNHWLNAMIFGLKGLDEMLGNIDFFRDNPQWRYAVLEQLSLHMMRDLSFRPGLKLQQHLIYEGVKEQFGEKLGEYDVLISVLCAIVNRYQKIVVDKNEQIAALKEST